jgi:subtilisin family serine protease
VIAVLDNGVDLSHPDIEGNLWENPSPDPIDEDLHGFDFVDGDGDPDDYNFHGTHVAGTAAAIADNTQGIAGVAPDARIMAVRVLDGDGSGNTADIAAGVAYASEHGAGVINMSLGGPAGAGDKAMADAIEAAGAEETVVVVAAGNEGADNELQPESPCVLPQANLICVAAINRSGALAGFSNFGVKSVDLAAPGTSILSSKPDYGAPVFEDGFEVEPSPWSTAASGGGKPWGLSESAANGEHSAADSPTGNYGQAAPGAENPAASELFTTDPVSLAGERGCRIHFDTKYEIESGFDVFLAGAVTESSLFHVNEFDGASPGYPADFTREEVSVSELVGQIDVYPFFGVFSDEEVQFDGAYVDDVRLICRDATYLDSIATGANYDQAESGSYVRFQGTSMATPHVAGEVALVRAAAPSLSAEEVVQAVLDGASALPIVTPGKRTATEGIADACKAVALATGADVAIECPASSEPTPQPPNGGTEPPVIPVEPDSETPNPFTPPEVTPPRPDREPSSAATRRRSCAPLTRWRGWCSSSAPTARWSPSSASSTEFRSKHVAGNSCVGSSPARTCCG